MALGHQPRHDGLELHRYLFIQRGPEALQPLLVALCADLLHRGDGHGLDLGLHQAGDVLHIEELPPPAGDGDGVAGAARAADAVDVDLAVLGNVVVDDVVHVVDVDAPRRHVRRH